MTELKSESLTTGDRVKAVLGTLKTNDTIHYDLALIATESVGYLAPVPGSWWVVAALQAYTYMRRRILGGLENDMRINRSENSGKPVALVEDRPMHEVLAEAWKTGKVQRSEDLVFTPKEEK